MAADTVAPAPADDVQELALAFRAFTAATTRLEREYAALQERVAHLTAELEDKNRLLAESLARERRLEAEALRQSRLAAMGEMAAMVAHEVRNPLGAMELFVGLLLQDLQAQPEPLRLARLVAVSVADLNHLVTNLLEYTRTRTAGRGAVDVDALADDVLRWTTELRAACKVVCERDVDPAATWAEGDPGLLRPVVMNLVRNAVQAMPDGGTLRLALRREADGRVRIDVADTGAGIAAGDEERIFRPFYTTRAKGTGLGLAVARELVEAMGGRIGVQSTPGQGATFSVWLRAAGTSEATELQQPVAGAAA
jgi:two-component system sensor histidine kinase HydH